MTGLGAALPLAFVTVLALGGGNAPAQHGRYAGRLRRSRAGLGARRLRAGAEPARPRGRTVAAQRHHDRRPPLPARDEPAGRHGEPRRRVHDARGEGLPGFWASARRCRGGLERLRHRRAPEPGRRDRPRPSQGHGSGRRSAPSAERRRRRRRARHACAAEPVPERRRSRRARAPAVRERRPSGGRSRRRSERLLRAARLRLRLRDRPSLGRALPERLGPRGTTVVAESRLARPERPVRLRPRAQGLGERRRAGRGARALERDRPRAPPPRRLPRRGPGRDRSRVPLGRRHVQGRERLRDLARADRPPDARPGRPHGIAVAVVP